MFKNAEGCVKVDDGVPGGSSHTPDAINCFTDWIQRDVGVGIGPSQPSYKVTDGEVETQ